MAQRTLEDVKAAIADVPDFPKPGIVFKDISPVLADPALFDAVIAAFEETWKTDEPDFIAGIESRGFLFGAALAHRMKVGFVPIRKPGKLPRKTLSQSYALEYGTDTLEIHADAFEGGAKVVILDDLLATGGTARAAWELCKKAGGDVVGVGFMVELGFLEGIQKLEGVPVTSLIRY
jgi:adenine phosphoribosyltransferase